MYVIRVFTILIALNLADAFLENIIDEAIVSLQENIYGPVWAHICTGKSLSEALIFASTNPQYDHTLFMKIVSS